MSIRRNIFLQVLLSLAIIAIAIGRTTADFSDVWIAVSIFFISSSITIVYLDRQRIKNKDEK